jgi:uncharacterized protein YkwD
MAAPRPFGAPDYGTPAPRTTYRGLGAAVRVGVLVVSIGLASSAARSAGASADAERAPQPAAATVAPAVAPTPPPDFTLRDAGGFGAVARFVEIANGPTSTPQPSPTPEPTTAPRPAPAEPVAPRIAQTVQEGPPPAAPIEPPPAPPPPVPPAASTPRGLNTAPMDAYAQQLFDDTNSRRASVGLPALRANGYLVGIARIRSQDMADNNYFAHVSPVTGDDAFSLMDAHGVPYGWAGENLDKNSYPEAQTVAAADQALWNSPLHRQNMLNPNYTDMGIALAVDAAGMKYFTIIFIGPP